MAATPIFKRSTAAPSGIELRGGKGYGNAGSMESVEKQKQLFPSFHSPLGISPKARDSHIPTAWHAPDGKVENQNQVSHFPTRGMRRRPRFVCFQNQKPRKEIGPLRGLLNHVFQDSRSTGNGTLFQDHPSIGKCFPRI